MQTLQSNSGQVKFISQARLRSTDVVNMSLKRGQRRANMVPLLGTAQKPGRGILKQLQTGQGQLQKAFDLFNIIELYNAIDLLL